MDNFIDWSDATSKSQNGAGPDAKQDIHVQTPSGNWQAQNHTTPLASAPIQNPYNTESEHKEIAQGRQPNNYTSSTYRHSYTNDAIMPSSNSPPITGSQQQYMYSPMLTHQHNSTQHTYPSVSDVSQQQQQHHSNGSAQYSYAQDTQQQAQSFPHPYTYANGSNSYNPYSTHYPSQSSYMAPYNSQGLYNAPVGNNGGNYPAQGVANHQQTIGSISPQVQYPYQYQHSQNTSYSQSPYQQYQRPEDALNRVQHTWQGPKPVTGTQVISHAQAPSYAQWQTQPGQTVYFGMDARPIPPVKPVQKPVTPASPPRPSDPLAALRYDVSHCLHEYNTSRDLKGCTAALLAIMTTCDPILSPEVRTDGKDNVAPEKLSTPSNSKEELDPKIKQTALLSVVCSEIKGAMIDEVSQSKSIRAKLRTWFVRAHKDSSFVVLKALIAVLDKLNSLTAQSLAEVKFGKALIIVSRKCEDQGVRDSLVKWVSKAEESLTIERELEVAASKPPPLEEESKKKKAKPSVGKLAMQQAQGSQSKRSDDKAKEVVSKKLEPVAKTNSAFFKRDTVPAVKAVIARPGMAAALAGIKARKKTESDLSGTENKPMDQGKPATKSSSSLSSTVTSSKPAFSALKLVEGLKRSASPVVNLDSESEAKRQKKKKRVSWRPDSELEQIQIFESVEPEVGSWEASQTPHKFGNARDLDRKEGALLHGGILPDRDEDFLDWENPRELDFNYRNLLSTSDMRGPKKAGSMKINSKCSLAETERELNVGLIDYSDETDIPWSPSETAVMIEQRTMSSQKPKIIPLPAELRDDWRVLQILGGLTSARADEEVTSAPPPLLESTTTQSPAGDARESVMITPVAPDITAILASIMAAQQKPTVVASLPAPAAAVVPQSQSHTTKNEVGESAFPIVDHKLAEFLAQMAATNGGFAPPPLPPRKQNPTGSVKPLINFIVPIRPLTMPTPNSGYSTAITTDTKRASGSQGQPLPAQFGGLRDVRPWVRFNDNGKYREPCRFIAIGKCEKGDQCGYLHLDVPGPGQG